MTKKLTIDQKLNQIYLILLGVTDGVTERKEALESIKKVVLNEKS